MYVQSVLFLFQKLHEASPGFEREESSSSQREYICYIGL